MIILKAPKGSRFTINHLPDNFLKLIGYCFLRPLRPGGCSIAFPLENLIFSSSFPSLSVSNNLLVSVAVAVCRSGDV